MSDLKVNQIDFFTNSNEAYLVVINRRFVFLQNCWLFNIKPSDLSFKISSYTSSVWWNESSYDYCSEADALEFIDKFWPTVHLKEIKVILKTRKMFINDESSDDHKPTIQQSPTITPILYPLPT